MHRVLPLVFDYSDEFRYSSACRGREGGHLPFVFILPYRGLAVYVSYEMISRRTCGRCTCKGLLPSLCVVV